MKRWVGGLVRKLTVPLPNLFDIIVACGVMPIGYVSLPYRGYYLVYYCIFVILISQFFDNKRSYSNKWLTSIAVYCFAITMLQRHFEPKGVISYYYNFCVMSEALMYVIFPVLFIRTVVLKSNNARFLYLTIPLSLIPVFSRYAQAGQVTIVFSVMVSLLIYAALRRKFKVVILCILIASTFFFAKSDWIKMKWGCRPSVIQHQFNECMEHPILGQGFNRMLTPDNMTWVKVNRTGWLYRHNDYLNGARGFGFLLLLLTAAFLLSIGSQIGLKWQLVPFMSICIMPIFQITMFQAEKALPIIALTALLIWDSI